MKLSKSIFDKEENDIPCLRSTVTVLDFFQ